MHERSLAKALLEQVEAHARAQGASRVTAVCVQLGPLAGVEPLLLASALEDGSAGTIAEGALIKLIEVPLVAKCLDCGRQFEVERFRFHCPACSSARTQLLQGDGVILESIVVLDEPVTTNTAAQG
jgi:hydrogenase nickel incorporation protein HypA/HybF